MQTGCFTITKKTSIFLYAYNVISKEKAAQLEQSGYRFRGIIDRNADVYGKECDFPVMTIEQLSQEITDKEHTVIIICIRNAMQHGQIVRNLRKYGFTKILYIPMEAEEEHKLLKRMMSAYQYFLDGMFTLLKDIPNMDEYIVHERSDAHSRLIYDEGDWITFWCDIEDIFIGDREWFAQRSPYVLEIEGFLFDVPVIHSYQHSDLFSYLRGEIDEPENCFKVTMKDDADRWKLYKQDRIELWKLFSKWLRQGMYMFTIHACPARRNAEGYFYLMDGGHRALFLYNHNIFKIPVRASRADYHAYLSYVKPEEYIYKSVELLLQEHLFKDVNISDKVGVLIGNSYTNRFFEKCSKKVYHWNCNENVSEHWVEVDYIFLGVVDEDFDSSLLVGLSHKCDMFFLETDRDFNEYEIGLNSDWHFSLIENAVQQNARTIKIYGISRKEK